MNSSPAQEKRAMTNCVSTLCLVLLCSAIFAGSSTLVECNIDMGYG